MADTTKFEQELLKVENWKQTRRKTSYSIYMCIPPVGTHIHNVLNNKDYVTGKNDVVLSGTREELWVEKLTKVIKDFTFADKSIITVPKITQKKKLNCLPWTRILPKVSKINSDFAFHVDKKYKNIVLPDGAIVNQAGIPHGIGDFLIVENLNGMPNIGDYLVINGEIFVNTYDMRAFTGMVNNNKQVIDAPYPKINLMPKVLQQLENAQLAQQQQIENEKVVKQEEGHAETDDFNLIAYRTFEYLSKHFDKYSYEIVDVVSNFADSTKNYAKIDIISNETEKAIARMIISITPNKYITVVLKKKGGKQTTIKADSIKEMTQTIQQYLY